MWNWIEKASELRRSGSRFVLVTVANVVGSVPREVGAKMIVLEDGSIFGTIGGGGLEKNAIASAQKFLLEGGQHVMRQALTPEHGHACGGTVEVLFEVQNQGDTVYVFGVGHVGQALCRTLEGTSLMIHAVDPRPEWCDSPNLPSSVQRHCETWNAFLSHAKWSDSETYVVILTWNHELDFEILSGVLKMPHRYIGLIGSRRKWETFRKKLLSSGFSEAELSKVRCPVGLPFGGKLPQEVAVSIAAEILQISQPANRE
jgi:xanthine dehydrogenase accessory factor